MQKQQKKNKKLWMLPLLSLVLISCAKNLPKPPEGELYLHDEPNAQALCSKLGNAGPCPSVGIKQTDKWFMLTPQTMKSVLNYIDELIYEIKKPQSAETKLQAIEGLEALKQELESKQLELNGN